MKINNNLYSLDAVDLAKKLLGKILVRNINGIEIESKIVEVEQLIKLTMLLED